uniref:Acetyl-coenzyme A carboxylase carboxyl transferase subunit beta n=1 Tax=Astragalus mollissimus var. mollissimus TaxID=2506115 RepID=A0A8K1N287_9FABA|nr:acetyl-CoA carboxylase carboxyltransferase beta [Astragalus mollissimus var. mollissimus]
MDKNSQSRSTNSRLNKEDANMDKNSQSWDKSTNSSLNNQNNNTKEDANMDKNSQSWDKSANSSLNNQNNNTKEDANMDKNSQSWDKSANSSLNNQNNNTKEETSNEFYCEESSNHESSNDESSNDLDPDWEENWEERSPYWDPDWEENWEERSPDWDSDWEERSPDLDLEENWEERSPDWDLDSDSEESSKLLDSEESSKDCEETSKDCEGSSKDSEETASDRKETASELMAKYKHLWVRCEDEDCLQLLYKSHLKEKMNICEYCGYHLKMSSSDRIELLIDPGTWNPMDEYMFSVDPIEWDSEEDPYRPDSYQKRTGLIEAIQTGTGQLNGIPLAIGIMDFQFIGGSMGSVVGEKITRLIEYATNQRLPLILVCASGGARMQEGSLSLMQMAKISSALYDYQINQKLFYVSILTSPTTGGVTASFGMLGDFIIAEPNAYIAFAGKRVIEQTLNVEVPEGVQEAEFLFEKGLFDAIVPRNLLKAVLTELFQLHGFVPITQNEK